MATHISPTQAPRASQTTSSTALGGTLFSARVLAVMLMLTGWGWDNGQFVQPVFSSWGPLADALHLIPIVALLPLGITIITAALAGARSRGAEIGVTIVAVITIVGCLVMIVLGATNPDPNSVGVHSPEDWMPTIVMNLGTLLWLGTFLFGRRAAQ
jgi:hypothetical protein